MSTHVTIIVNGKPQPAPAAATVSTVLEILQVDASRAAVEVNDQLIPREQHAQLALQDNDRLEIVTLAGGG